MKRIVVGSVMAVLISLGGTAFAQTAAPKAHRQSDDCAEQRRRDPNVECVLELERETVVVDKKGGFGETIVIRDRPVFGSMIRVRATMVDKIIRSANN